MKRKIVKLKKMKMETVPNERALLMYLISKFQLLDPDVIIVSIHDGRCDIFSTECHFF